MNTPHIHKDLIIAWANGAEIEYLTNGKWLGVGRPTWAPDCSYRIKPKVVKARAYRRGTDPTIYVVSDHQPVFLNDLYVDVNKGLITWISGWFEIPLTE